VANNSDAEASAAVGGPVQSAQNKEMPSYPMELDAEGGLLQDDGPPPAYYPLPDDMVEMVEMQWLSE